MRPDLLLNLATPHWSEEELSFVLEELSFVLEQFALARNHTIIRMEITTKKNLFYIFVANIRCNKCGTEFQCTSWNYIRCVNKDNFLFELEKIRKYPRPKPNVCPRCKGMYLSKYNNAKKGKDHPRYVHGLSSLEQKRPDFDRPAYKEWKFQVHRHFKGVCFLTGSREDLVCHHLASWCSCKEKRYVPSNGVLIQRKIHDHFHSVHGNITTAKQFEEYSKKYFDIHVFPWNQPDYQSTQPIDKNEVREKANLFQQEILELIQQRGYIHKEGVYENKRSVMTIEYPIHGKIHKIKAYTFKKAKYGMPCCAARSPLVTFAKRVGSPSRNF